MRKEIWLLCLPLLLLGGCGTQEKAQDPPQIITRKTVQEAKKAETPPAAKETPPAAKETPAPAETPEPAPQKEEQPAPKPVAPEGKKSKYPVFEYPYNLETDRQNFDYNNIDIVVGDKRYMTQINDWFMNFRDYKDKTVLIEGYFISINGHYFVGRNGPTCPYCTGGYVDFEFTSDGDFTGYEDGVTWIKVYGILREATVHLNDHLTAPFYHLEAVKVERMDQPGIGTITD